MLENNITQRTKANKNINSCQEDPHCNIQQENQYLTQKSCFLTIKKDGNVFEYHILRLNKTYCKNHDLSVFTMSFSCYITNLQVKEESH